MSKSRAIKGIDEDMKLNKALWQMAEVLCARAKHNKDYIKPNRGVTSTPESIRNADLTRSKAECSNVTHGKIWDSDCGR